MSIAIASCRNHPAREAIGVCVACRTRVCTECSTKVDGINYCVACLAALAGPRVSRPPAVAGRSSTVLATAAGGTLLVFVTLLAWALLETALPS